MSAANDRPLRLGSRRSPMAISQSTDVARLITQRTGREVEIVGITSAGDVSTAQLTQIGGTGVFVSTLRESLLREEVDFAVHSLKDLPTASAEGITLAAIPPRDDPRDALVGRDGRKLADLPAGARIGTGSPRRAAQLSLLRGDLACVPIRGNANTRLAKLRDGQVDALVLAYAGLARIGYTDLASDLFEPSDMLPAPGQGALAVECRAGDEALAELLAAVDDAATRRAVTAERSLLAALEAGCSAPVGAYACGEEGAASLRLDGVVLGLPAEGAMTVVREQGEGEAAEPERLGRELAARMLARGAAQLLSPAGTSPRERAAGTAVTTDRDDEHG